MNIPPRPKKGQSPVSEQASKPKPKKGVHTPQQYDQDTDDGEDKHNKEDGAKKSKLAAVKEGIKRPLSSLLRRPSSRSGSRERMETIEMPTTEREKEEPQLPPQLKPAKKMGGWGNGDVAERPATAAMRKFSFGRSSGKKQTDQMVLDQTMSLSGVIDSPRNKMIELQDNIVDDGTIENIAQLEEAGMDYGTNVAQAPSIPVHRVATFRELDNMLLKNPVFSSLEGDFDLSILAKPLCPERDIVEEDVAWTWDYLFTTISSELRKEWEDQKAETENVQNQEVGQVP